MRDQTIASGHFYHIYNRGVNRESIFFHEENWLFFLRRLRHYFDRDLATIQSYCLMPNHFHLLVHVTCDDFGRTVMHPFTVSYTKAINKQQNRVGSLFQGPFQARCVSRDADLIHLSRYIHMNPVQANLVSAPEMWEYSSYRDYIGLRTGTLPSTELILGQFPSRQAYVEFVCAGRDTNIGVSESLLMDWVAHE